MRRQLRNLTTSRRTYPNNPAFACSIEDHTSASLLEATIRGSRFRSIYMPVFVARRANTAARIAQILSRSGSGNGTSPPSVQLFVIIEVLAYSPELALVRILFVRRRFIEYAHEEAAPLFLAPLE